MPKEFIWDESSVQTYTKEYGTQKLTPYQHDSDGPFWKDPGADFTMDAEGESLTLVMSGTNGEDNTLRWPSQHRDGSGVNMNLVNGNLIVYYDKKNTLRSSGVYLGDNRSDSSQLFLTLKNTSNLEIISCPFVSCGARDNFILNMSGTSHFNLESSTATEADMWNILGGTFTLQDNASFTYEFSNEESKYKAIIISLFATLSDNAKMEFTDNTATSSRLKFSDEDGDIHFNLNGEKTSLIFRAKDHPLFSVEEITSMNTGTFNFITGNKINNSEIVIQHAGKNEIFAFGKRGAISIDGVPQYDAKKVNFDYDPALPGLRISLKN